MKTILRMLTAFLIGFLSLVLIFVIVLLFYSPGKPEPFKGQDGMPVSGSISEKTFVKIGGVSQGMFIRGEDVNNPVLLYIHGGPAFPNYFLIDRYKPGLEENFTVCYWEQRGGGLSYNPEVPLESMNFDQLASDAIEVSNYLRERFSKEKIYIVAHSGGTPFAIMAVARAPHLYHAYIGMGQITSQSASDRIAYKYMLDIYSGNGNDQAVNELKTYPILDSAEYNVPFYKSLVRDKSMHELGIGTMHDMRSVLKGVFIPVWTCKAYTIREKMNIWISKFSFLKKTRLIDELFATDVTEKVSRVEIPVYFFSGKYDLTVNHDLSKAYLEKLEAPLKGFYTFAESAHSPIYEEPQRFREIIMTDVVNSKTSLADISQ